MILYFSATGSSQIRRKAARRRAQDGVRYVDSWVTADDSTCCQINESRSEALLHEWTANWPDVTEFEFIPVISSREMREKMAQEA
ncbi:MAG: DUF3303 family protein [Oscillospiraceae bacterium]